MTKIKIATSRYKISEYYSFKMGKYFVIRVVPNREKISGLIAKSKSESVDQILLNDLYAGILRIHKANKIITDKKIKRLDLVYTGYDLTLNGKTFQCRNDNDNMSKISMLFSSKNLLKELVQLNLFMTLHYKAVTKARVNLIYNNYSNKI